MFKLLRLFLPLLILVFVLPMIVPGPNGKPVMSPKDWLPDQSTLNKVSHFLTEIANKVASSVSQNDYVERQLNGSSNQFYQWQDENGQWHFSDDPAQAQGYQVSQKPMPEVANRIAPPVVDNVDNSEPVTSKDKQSFQFSPTSIPIQDIPKLIEDTKKVRAQLEQRNNDLDSM